MILQKEIIDKAQEWKVPQDTVDKDYVLGHFLSVFVNHFKDDLVFKGGTCLRKCYIENYRFSEDLDFTALNKGFALEQKTLVTIAKKVTKHSGILLFIEPVKPMLFEDQLKGYQVKIKYWGANHLKNQQPLPHSRWNTKIKLEVSTDELMLLDTEMRHIMHPYSDELFGNKQSNCYSLSEVVAEKLRALMQRSYTAPRDFYDLFHLTKDFNKEDWDKIKPIFLQKMGHKNLKYKTPEDLIDDSKLVNAERAWKASVEHQIKQGHQPEAKEIINTVAERIKTYL